MPAGRRLLRQSIAVRSWPLWSLQPRWLVAFVLAVIAADLAAICVAASSTTVTGSNLALFGLLVGCTAASALAGSTRCAVDQTVVSVGPYTFHNEPTRVCTSVAS